MPVNPFPSTCMGTNKNNIGNNLSNSYHEYDTSAHHTTSTRSFNSIGSSDLDFNSNSDTNMAAPQNRSPSKSCRRKVAMIVKKPKSPKMENVISSLEGELTDFLSNKQAVPSKVDDSTSLTSRTTKSSHGSKNSQNGTKGEKAKESSKTHKSNRDKGAKSKHSSKSEKDSSFKEVPWDWSHHSNDWMDIATTSQNGFEQSFAEFPKFEDDEHVRRLNDSMDEDMINSNHQNNSAHDCMSPLLSPGGRRARKPHSSRRVQKQLEIQEALNQSLTNDSARRRLGEVPFGSGREIPLGGESRRDSSSKARRRSSFNGYNSDDTSSSNLSSNSPRSRKSRTNGSSRPGSRTVGRSSSRDKSSKDKSRAKSRDRPRDQSRDKPRDKSRDKSLSQHKSREKSREKSRDMSRDRSGSGHHRSNSQSRRGTRRVKYQAQPRSRSFDPAPTEAKENASFSSASRRGRRRSSINNSAAVEQPAQSRSERGRRRGSMGHIGTSSTEHQGERDNRQSKHRRGSSLSARTSRRCSMDRKLDHSNSGSSKDSTPNEPSRRRHRSRSSNHRRPRSSKGLDVSSRSLTAEELLPERLSQMMGRGGSDQSHLEKLALAILVAEGENDMDQDICAAVEKLPTHLLDPSKVRLNMQW